MTGSEVHGVAVGGMSDETCARLARRVDCGAHAHASLDCG